MSSCSDDFWQQFRNEFYKEVAEEEENPLESRGIVEVTKCGRTEPSCSVPKIDVLRQNTGVTGGRKEGGRVQQKGRSAIEEEERRLHKHR